MTRVWKFTGLDTYFHALVKGIHEGFEIEQGRTHEHWNTCSCRMSKEIREREIMEFEELERVIKVGDLGASITLEEKDASLQVIENDPLETGGMTRRRFVLLYNSALATTRELEGKYGKEKAREIKSRLKWEIEETLQNLKAWRQAIQVVINEDSASASAEEKEKIKESDAKFVPASHVSTVRAPKRTEWTKTVESLMKLGGMSKEDAEKWLIRNRK